MASRKHEVVPLVEGWGPGGRVLHVRMGFRGYVPLLGRAQLRFGMVVSMIFWTAYCYWGRVSRWKDPYSIARSWGMQMRFSEPTIWDPSYGTSTPSGRTHSGWGR